MEKYKDDAFGLLIDKSVDISHRAHMSVVLCYVDKMGIFKERFIWVVHVQDYDGTSLREE